MSDSDLFRKEAMAHRGETEPLNGLLRVTAPHEWLIVIGLGAALLAVLLWAFLGRIDRTVAVACVFAHPGERQAVIATVSGSVVDVLADVGDVVEAGQPLARVNVPDPGQNVALARAKARIAALESQQDVPAEAMALARAELAELEAAQEAGQFIVSPHAGQVVSHSLALGQAVTSGTPVARILNGAEPLEAIAYLTPDTAHRIEAGMEASITPAAAGGPAGQPLAGGVVFVAERLSPPPDWLGDFGLAAPARSHLVRMSLAEPAASSGSWRPLLRDGDICSARIVLGSDPPLALLNSLGVN